MLIKVDRPDLAWQVAIQRREAILWIGSAFSHLRQADRLGALEEVLLCPWAAVYVDADRLPLLELIERHRQIGSLVLRVFDDASPGALPPNRLPIYRLRGPKGSVGPGATSDPAALLARYAMLKQAPVGLEVFALGIETPEDTAALLEAVSLAPEAFGRLVVTSPAPPDLAPVGAKASRVICWCARRDEFVRVLPPPGASGEAADAHILVQTATGPQQVDLGPCIEPGHPITTAFQFVSAGEILAETRPNEEMVRAFLADPAGSWLPYAAGIPYPRHRPYEKLLLKELKKFGREGPAASCTAWLAAEDGSGATTVLRQVCLDIARQGYPVLVARGNAPSFDFQQVSGFLTRATDRLAAAGVSVPDLPWVIAFDAEHTQLHWEFLSGVANGLKNLQKPVLVLAVRPLGVRYDARGVNRTLGDPLANTLPLDDGVELGEHLGRFLPVHMRRHRSEWQTFIADTIRSTVEGRRKAKGTFTIFAVYKTAKMVNVPFARPSLQRGRARSPATDPALTGWGADSHSVCRTERSPPHLR